MAQSVKIFTLVLTMWSISISRAETVSQLTRCAQLNADMTERLFSDSERAELQQCLADRDLAEATQRGDKADSCLWLEDKAMEMPFNDKEKQALQNCIVNDPGLPSRSQNSSPSLSNQIRAFLGLPDANR